MGERGDRRRDRRATFDVTPGRYVPRVLFLTVAGSLEPLATEEQACAMVDSMLESHGVRLVHRKVESKTAPNPQAN